MARPIAYNASGPLSGSIRGGNVNYTVDSGNRDYTTFASKKWVPSADGAAPIVFVTDTYTQGFELNPNLAVPLFYSCNGTGSAAILYTANRIPNSPGNYSDANVALNDLITARGYFILESNDPYQGIDADSLVFDMDASKMSSYPQTGVNVYDLSGNRGSGTLNNGVSWNATSGSFFFDGTDDDIYVSNYNAINMVGTQPYTAMATVYPLLGGTTWHGIFSKGNLQQYALTINSPSAYLHYESNQSAYGALNSAGGAVDVNRWQHFVARFDGNEKTIWKNGEIIATQATPGLSNSDNTEELRIGEGNTGEQFRGEITSVQVYRRSLSTAEIKQNYFGAPIVTDGLVFAVDANNIVSYPKSGTTAYSLTGSNTATLVNGVGYGLQNGGTFVFDGTDDYIQTNLSQNTDNALITWECWYFDDSPGGYTSNTALISNYGPSGTTPYTLLHVTTAGNALFAQRSSVGAEASAFYSGNICDGKWHHVVGTVDATNISIYIDGVLQSSNVKITGVTTSGQNIVIGGNHLDRYQSCRIANARLYNVALTPSQILQNYQAEQYRFEDPLNIPTFGLQAYWDASNLESYPGSGTTWTDIVSGNTMTWSSPAPQWNVNQFTTTPLVGSLRPMISTGYINGRTGSGAYTVVAIFKPLSLGANQILFSMGPANNNCSGENIHPIAINSAGRFGGGACGGLGTWTSGGGVVPTTTKYYCVATVFDGSTETVYVDGAFDKSAAMSTTTPVSSANRYSWGWIRDDGAPYGMDAQLGVILYYNRAISATEVTQIYNAYKDTYQM